MQLFYAVLLLTATSIMWEDILIKVVITSSTMLIKMLFKKILQICSITM